MKLRCPKCGNVLKAETELKRKCKRCGHLWTGRSEKKPGRCPRCKSPYWDKERGAWKLEKLRRMNDNAREKKVKL